MQEVSGSIPLTSTIQKVALNGCLDMFPSVGFEEASFEDDVSFV
jgi:hypothetical protein